MRPTDVQRWSLYLISAAVGMVLDVACVSVLRRLPGVPLVAAVAMGFAANVLSGYALSHLVVFKDHEAALSRSTTRYAAVVVMNVVVAVGGVTLLVSWGVPYVLGRLTSTAIIVPSNYLLLRQWIFPAPRPAGATE